jgi:xanthosine utilization system XapX-like protein
MGYIPAMLVALALAGVAGWFLGKRLSPWWKWLVAAFAGGAAIAFAVALTQGLLGWMAPGQAVVRGIATAPMAGIVAVFVAWIASRRC